MTKVFCFFAYDNSSNYNKGQNNNAPHNKHTVDMSVYPLYEPAANLVLDKMPP